MIDDKINKALIELEANLRSVRSANDQVNNTVNAYKALTASITTYTESLSAVKDSVEKLVKVVDKRVAEFDNDRNQIVASCNQVITDVNQTIQDAKQTFDDNIKQIRNKFAYVIALNGIILLTLVLLHFLR